MKLKKVHIREFQSILDSTEFEVGDITCLVGKNEAGKTALLRALYRLNPILEGEGNFSVTDDYPRWDVDDYETAVSSEEREPATAVAATFELEPSDTEDAEQVFGPKLFDSRIVVLRKGYANVLDATLHVDEKAALSYFVSRRQFTPDVKTALDQARTAEEMTAALVSVEATSAVTEVQTLLAQIKKHVNLRTYVYRTFVLPQVPKFLYFDEYYQMEGRANIDSLKQRDDNDQHKSSDYPMLGLIALARLTLKDLLSPTRTRELKNKLEAAGNTLTKQIVKYWSQNRHLRLEFDVRPALPKDPPGMTQGTNIWGDVEDTKHRVTTELGTRSKGFVWFFSFLAWYSQQKRDQENLILLLDEPGLTLHGKAQEDLLRYFEAEIKGVHQLIYTTHSPFMVDPTRFERVRIVQDLSIDTDEDLPAERRGTKVTTDVLDATGDSLFPLQGALGYELYQTLFIGPNSLVVEGVSDLLYLQAMTGVLARLARPGLSPQWTITPVGGSDKVPTFVALIGSQRKSMNVAVLIDFQKKDSQTIENLWKRKLLDKKKVVTFAEFATGDEADIEDLFEPQFYLDLVSAEYAVTKAWTLTDLPAHPRITARLAQHFEAQPLPGGAVFNHYRPARYFVENIATLESSLSPDTVERFAQVFERVNALLKK